MSSTGNPLVSIGIPTYNRANGNLLKVVERALAQTYQNVEVIVSDNCSSDHTQELVQSIEDPRVRYFRQETNIGPNNNFNFCLNQARGEYFLLFHDDDMIDHDFVETCISSLEPGQSVGAIFTGVRIIDENDSVLEEYENKGAGLSPLEFIQGWFRDTTVLYLCSTLYKTVCLKEVGGFSSKKNLYDDLVPTFTLATRYGRLDVAEVKAGFRRHSGNRGSSVPINDWIEDSLYLLDVLYRLLPDERTALSTEGELYFCKKMYRNISEGLAASHSCVDYFYVYKTYHYCYSPLHYLYKKKWDRRVEKIKKTIAIRQ
ncbi:MAG TPA: glycosyltransferase family 2 protein [Gammaproteobacteria bacterium]|nr:glycosyltransferase family 2 protein [Gammaproteobacteria bacterium]